MAHPHALLWNTGQGIALRSVVIVQSFKFVPGGKRKSVDSMPTDYDVCAGVIVETDGSESYIAVHASCIDKGNVEIYVYLAGCESTLARVYLRNTTLQFVILVASLGDPMSQKVRAKKISERDDILMVSAHGISLVPFVTSIINPDTKSTSKLDWETIAAGSERFFTFGRCKDSVGSIMGAPLFLRDGRFIGVVWGDESTLAEYENVEEIDRCPHLKYGLHASFFLSDLRKEIKEKKSKKNKQRRNVRR